MRKPSSICAVAFALAAGLTAAQQPMRVGIAFDSGGKFDRGFSQSAYEGSQRAAKDFKISLNDFEPQDPSQIGQGVRNFAQNGFDLTIGVGFATAPSITEVAKDFPDQKFAIVDSVSPEKNVAGLVFREEEGSYLVGYVAGRMSSTGVVGFLGGMDIPLIHKFEAGYTAGVRAACPTCRVIPNYIGSTPAAWNDPARAKEIAVVQISRGADIIYAAASASGIGMYEHVKAVKCLSPNELPSGVRFRAASPMANLPKARDYTAKCGAAARPVFFIGVNANQNYLGDTDDNPATMNHGLTSMLKRVDNAVYAVIGEVTKGTFKGGARQFGLSNNGVGYALDEYNKAAIPSSLVLQLETVKRRIVAGTIKVPAER